MYWLRCSLMIVLSVLVGCEKLGSGESWWVEHEDTTVSYAEKYTSVDGVNYTLASTRYEREYVTRYSDGETLTESEVDTALPDSGRGEYDRVRLGRRGDIIVLLFEYRYVTEYGEPFELSGQSDLELVSGTWKDFAADKEVMVRFTDEGRRALLTKMERDIGAIYHNEIRNMTIEDYGFEGIDESRVHIETGFERFEMDNTPFRLSRSAINWGSTEPTVSIFKTWVKVDG